MNRVSACRLSLSAVILIFTSLPCAGLHAGVVVNEIMYNPTGGGEYIELHNSGPTAVELGGWSLSGAVEFTAAEGASIGAGAYLVVAADAEVFTASYPGVPAEALLGEFSGSLGNDGELLMLSDSDGAVIESFSWGDNSPWDFLADGYGASLERLCADASPGLSENWRAGTLPVAPDEASGTPARVNDATVCPPLAAEVPAVKISEIMYHAVLEEAVEDSYEFVEIYNGSDSAMDLGGWRLTGGVDFTFPADSTIEPGAYRVIARNPRLLAGVEAYGLSEASLFGPWERTLDNGGEKLALVSVAGRGVEAVAYDDEFPWPLAADALGAGAAWLDPAILPLEDHRYMGHSLERVSFGLSAAVVGNWAPSPLDGATPGRPNASARATPLAVVSELLVAPEGAASSRELIRSGDPVVIQVAFSPAPPSGAVRLEYFVENIESDGEQVTTVSMFDDGAGGGDLIPEDGIFTATLPERPDNTIVRYRVLTDRGAGAVPISPRPTDPFAWHAYFVSPVIATQTRVYQLFIARTPWARLWSNVQGGRVSGCARHPTWNSKEFAIFVYDGKVYDCRVRYQGSRWNRRNGRDISRWTRSRPRSGPLKALSWRISLPRYAGVDGADEITLNKLSQGCPGYNAGVGYRLFAEADLPSPRTRFIRFHINGGYYHYMMQYERPDENLIRRYNREQAQKYPDRPRELVGNLYKSVGCNCDEGPYGWGDGRLLPSRCGHPSEARYAATYPRKTHEWNDHNEIKTLIEQLNTARRGGLAAQRAFFERYFDIDLLLNYVAIMNWSVPFDDMFQNHFWYQRLGDGKWMLAPWDLDRNFGEWQGATSSLYMGQQGDSSNRSGWWHYVKDSFLRSYREEYLDRLFTLNNTLLLPENIDRLVDLVTAEANPVEAAAAPAGLSCSFPGRAASFKSFARQRHDIVNRTIASVDVDAGSDQTVFVGQVVQFDGRESTPEPSESVTYEWDNGMAGAYPTAVFDAPGEYEVTLTVTVRGLGFTDTCTVRVIELPAMAFRERAGVVVMEAESFWMNESFGNESAWWDEETELEGASGASYVRAMDTGSRRTYLSRFVGISPELRYAIEFETPGEYRVWVRAHVTGTRSDSVHLALDGAGRASRDAQEFIVDESGFGWSGNSRRDEPQVLTVSEPGVHYLSMWIRESGLSIDKLVMTRDPEFVPEGEGPAESARTSLGGGPEPFVRGDTNRDGRLDISDPVATLLYLFQGSEILTCEDHGDVDDNGILQLTDPVLALSFLFREGSSPAPPFPEPGLDPTADDYDCGGP